MTSVSRLAVLKGEYETALRVPKSALRERSCTPPEGTTPPPPQATNAKANNADKVTVKQRVINVGIVKILKFFMKVLLTLRTRKQRPGLPNCLIG